MATEIGSAIAQVYSSQIYQANQRQADLGRNASRENSTTADVATFSAAALALASGDEKSADFKEVANKVTNYSGENFTEQRITGPTSMAGEDLASELSPTYPKIDYLA